MEIGALVASIGRTLTRICETSSIATDQRKKIFSSLAWIWKRPCTCNCILWRSKSQDLRTQAFSNLKDDFALFTERPSQIIPYGSRSPGRWKLLLPSCCYLFAIARRFCKSFTLQHILQRKQSLRKRAAEGLINVFCRRFDRKSHL